MPRLTRRSVPPSVSIKRERDAAKSALTLYWTTDTHVWHTPVDGAGFFYKSIPAKLAALAAALNADRPHAFLLTGDAIERGDAASGGPDANFADLRSMLWDVIHPSIAKMWAPGNHDYAIDPDPGSILNDTIARCMGTMGDPVVAGGRFNKSTVVTGNGVSVRFLLIDSLQERDGTTADGQAAIDKGSLSNAQKAWITAELAASPQDVIVLAAHTGAQDTRDSSDVWGVPQDRLDLVKIVQNELSARPRRKIINLFGHWHVAALRTFGNVDNFPGYLAPCLVHSNPAAVARLRIFADGTVLADTAAVVRGAIPIT